jgi:hypothetical protein
MGPVPNMDISQQTSCLVWLMGKNKIRYRLGYTLEYFHHDSGSY